jgi:virginiamycin B lyase
VERGALLSLSGKSRSSNRKIILYAVIGILAVAAVSITFLSQRPATPQDLADSSKDESIALFKQQFCGPEGKANSNAYIAEHVLKSECELPLGIAVDSDRVWYVSTKQGTLGSYSLSDGNMEEFAIPSWPARSDPTGFSMVFAAKVDGTGHVWFTDDKQNLLWRFNKSDGTFEMFKSPAVGPISFDFDKGGNMYLVGVRSKSLYYADVSQLKPGTTDGFREIKLPLDAFSGIDSFRVSSGSVAVDKERNVVWSTVLAYQQKGQVFRYDVAQNRTTVFDLPSELASPVGTVLDKEGNLWLTDHGTSIFFMLDASDGKIIKYVTSVPSSRVFGGAVPANAVSWPYWMQRDGNDNIWFNQHAGNKIGKFDIKSQTLTEYWIPTQNNKLESCPPGAQTCGIANAIQFSVGPQNEVWFSEWSENKIGRVDAGAQVPFSVSAPEQVTVSRGGNVEVKVDISAQKAFEGDMIASATFVPTGQLGNSTGIFSQQSISVGAGGSKQVSFVLTPASEVVPGQYMLMIGAENQDVSVLKAVRVNVV